MASRLFANEGEVVIEHKGSTATLYVDGKKHTELTKEFTVVTLEEGNHVLKLVEPTSKYSEKHKEKEIYISPSGSVNTRFKFEKSLEPTEAYQKILDRKDLIKLQRFTRTKSMTVKDTKLGLLWQDDEYQSRKERDFNDATAYCQSLEFAMFDDWRVPTYEELLTLVDYDRFDPAIVPLFKKTFPHRYWSSSSDASSPDYIWSIDFLHGRTSTSKKSKKYYVRCVRSE
jgi:hypothetical protein